MKQSRSPLKFRSEIPFDNRYDWLGASFQKLKNDPLCARKSAYIWGVLQGTALGKVLGLQQVSVIEFGVAGGSGLLSNGAHCGKG
jgi:hypothetical protein